MEAFLVSTGAVAFSEVGDKTQLLALLLAARYRRPWPLIAGIAVATFVNHAAAGALGIGLSQWIAPEWLRWLLGGSFLLVAIWLLVPDRLDDSDAGIGSGRAPPGAFGVFAITALAFFVAEIGDKTQVATVMLAVRFDALIAVTAGTTLGLLLANIPAVLLGPRALRLVPAAWVQRIAALVFALIGLLVLAGVEV